jgi:hypothetical protein
MTTYSLTWDMAAFRQLNALRDGSVDMARFDAASDEIDFVLRRLPDDVGESRDEGCRLWYGPFFAVFYSLDETKKSIRVHSVALS